MAAAPLVCGGLCFSAFASKNAEAFEQLCRVPDRKFSTLTADLLLHLHANAVRVGASAAFFELIARRDDAAGRMVADVLGQQDSTYSGIGHLFLVDRARAELLTEAASQLQRKLGGFYEGKLDHLGRGCSCAGVEAGVEIAVEKWPCNRPLHRSTPLYTYRSLPPRDCRALQLYRALHRCRALQFYTASTLYTLYTIPLAWPSERP